MSLFQYLKFRQLFLFLFTVAKVSSKMVFLLLTVVFKMVLLYEFTIWTGMVVECKEKREDDFMVVILS